MANSALIFTPTRSQKSTFKRQVPDFPFDNKIILLPYSANRIKNFPYTLKYRVCNVRLKVL